MGDNEPVPQLPEAVREDVKTDGDAKKEKTPENDSITKIEGTEHPKADKEEANPSEKPAPEARTEPTSSTQDTPQQQSPPKRPQGKGRPRRFLMKNNTPYIQQPEVTKGKGRAQGGRRTQTSSSKPAKRANGTGKDEVVSTVQVPDHITLDPELLHYDPPDSEPESELELVGPAQAQGKGKGKGSVKLRPPPLTLVDYAEGLPSLAGKTPEKLPVSPPERPPRSLRLADGKRGTTLYQLLMVINQTLAAEMKKSPDVKLALYPEIRGPLRALGLMGRFVRLLFCSMEQHRTESWQKKKAAAAARRRGGCTPPAPPAQPFRGALAMFQVPVTHHLQSTTAQGLSVLTTGVAREDEVEDEQDSPVWQAMQRAERRYLDGVRKRSHRDVSDSDEGLDVETSSDESSDNEVGYLRIASPSLPPRVTREDVSRQTNDLNPRRHETWMIPEQSRKEAAENKMQRREARAIARQEKAARNEIMKQAQREAEIAVRRHLANLTDERDAALYLAETATYERDDMSDQCAALRKDSEQLRRLMKALVDKESEVFAAIQGCKDENAAKESLDNKKDDKKDGQEDGNEASNEEAEQRDKVMPLPLTPAGNLPTSELRHRSSRPPRSPLPLSLPMAPKSPVPWTPTTPISEWDRRHIVSEARRVLREGGPEAPPTTPAFPPTPSRRRPITDLSLAYRIDTIRAPLGYGFLMTAMDVVYSLGLITWRQKNNLVDVVRWLWYYCMAWRCFGWLAALWTNLQQLAWRVMLLRKVKDKSSTAPAVRDTTALALRSRDTQLGRSHPPRALGPRRFPRDAFAELVIGSLIILAGFVAAAAIMERNLWLLANSDDTGRSGEVQRRFMYTYVLRHHMDTDTCETFPSGIGYGPYHVCGCVGTGVDLRMLLVPVLYFWVLTWEWLNGYQQMLGVGG
ncbi:hypothetical protein SCUCBS95973_005811 [Sporothrix curviconia]|uniref:Uncharacterized protein n=1 Tax=Sporothrix curviconia TaxID=1260050 RepID=A0ABP0C0A7_9PEZI